MTHVAKSEQITLSWVIASEHPQRLADFYAALLGAMARPGFSPSHWLISPEGGSLLQIYRPSSQRERPPQGRAWAPCLSRSSEQDPLVALQQWCDQAQRHGAQMKEPPRLESFGAECWMVDPEHNSFLLLMTLKPTP
ncbi:MAG: VOC family protein [Synechococcus sp.]